MSRHIRATSRVIAWVLVAVSFLLALTSCASPPAPLPPREATAATGKLSVAWRYDNARSDGYPLAAGEDSMVFVYRAVQDSELVAIHPDTGRVAWNRPLPVKEQAIQSLAAWDKVLLSGSHTELTAYSATTGYNLWQTHLGDGHVPVILQVDADVLRVYYGENLIEVNPVDGTILGDIPIGDVLWIQDTVVIHATADGHTMWATAAGSGTSLWPSNETPFLRKEWSFPTANGPDSLLAGLPDGSVCSLSLSTGIYQWCRHDGYVSNVAVDTQGGLAYALTESFALQVIDSTTGDLLKSLQFLPSALPESLRDHGFWYSVATSGADVSVLFGDSWQVFGLTGSVP